jgi:DNA sulfur modification protein DndB
VVTVNLQQVRKAYPRSELQELKMFKGLEPAKASLFDKFYREFHVFTTFSLVGGIEGWAINRDRNIRLEAHYHGVPSEEVGAIMLEMVDQVIEEKELDIPPYQPPVPKEEKSVSQVSQEIAARNEAQAKAYRDSQTFEFEAQSGVQAGGLMFTAILPFKKVNKLIDVNLSKVPQEERYQRVPSAARVKVLSSYVVQYQENYILPSITCTIEGEYEFNALAPRSSFGTLTLPPGTKLHPIDGGHRLNSINVIVNQTPKLEEEEICVMFVVDRGLRQRRQWFSDINKEQVKPPKAISLEYDRRDREANFHRDVIDEIPLFAKYTERAKGSAGGKNSNNLFVLTWLHGADKLLRPGNTYEMDMKYCVEWWKAVVANIPILANYDPQDPRMSPEDVREHLCCTALALKALAIVGKAASYRYRDKPEGLTEFLKPLSKIDWSKEDEEWEGLIIETSQTRTGPKRKILTRNTDQLVEFLTKKLRNP